MMSLAVFVLLFFLFYTAHSFCLTPTCGASKQQRTRTLRELSASNTTGLRGLPSNNFFLNSFDEEGIGRARQRSWDEWFQLVKDYKKVYKTTRVKMGDDRALAKWVSLHRSNNDSLSQERIDLLDSIGFEWEKGQEKKERRWQEQYEKLLSYKDEHGNCLVPARYDADPALGRWVHKQRKLKKDGLLQPKREKQLDQIGFVWQVRNHSKHESPHFELLWEQQYNKTVAFNETHGHCMVPWSYAEDPQLGKWVRTQREVHKKGDMRPDRVRKLNKIGFVWECVHDDKKSLQSLHWETMFGHLLDFKAETGHTDVPQSYGNFGLGGWVVTQRTLQSQNNLSCAPTQNAHRDRFSMDAYCLERSFRAIAKFI